MERNRFSPEDQKIQDFIAEQQAEFSDGATIVTEPILGQNETPESIFNTLKQTPKDLLESLFTAELHRIQESPFIEFYDQESIAEIIDSKTSITEDGEINSFYSPKERHSHDLVKKCLLICQGEFTEIPSEFIEFVSSVLKTRTEEYTQKSEILKRDFDVLKQKLKPKLEKTIPLTSEEVDLRLSGIQFILFDPLTTNDSRPLQKTDKKQIHLPYDFSLADLAHELTHTLAGQTWQEKTEVSDSGEKTQEIRSTRNGLLFEPNNGNVQNFTWLDEALTESITREWIGNPQTREYAAEIKLLEKIINGQSDRVALAREAYFENYSPNNKHRTEKIAEFFQATNKNFSPEFLVNLSYFIAQNNSGTTGGGVKMTLEKWNELGTDFPEFLKKSKENQS